MTIHPALHKLFTIATKAYFSFKPNITIKSITVFLYFSCTRHIALTIHLFLRSTRYFISRLHAQITSLASKSYCKQSISALKENLFTHNSKQTSSTCIDLTTKIMSTLLLFPLYGTTFLTPSHSLSLENPKQLQCHPLHSHTPIMIPLTTFSSQ